MTTKFQIGELAFAASVSYITDDISCPVCFGKLKVQIILGDDSIIEVPCEYCARGWDGPTGKVKSEYYNAGVVKSIIVTGIRVTLGHETEYMAECYVFSESQLCETRGEAEELSIRLAQEKTEAKQKEAESAKDKPGKSYSWHVGYHQREIRDHEKQLEYHRKKLVIVKEGAQKYKKGESPNA